MLRVCFQYQRNGFRHSNQIEYFERFERLQHCNSKWPKLQFQQKSINTVFSWNWRESCYWLIYYAFFKSITDLALFISLRKIQTTRCSKYLSKDPTVHYRWFNVHFLSRSVELMFCHGITTSWKDVLSILNACSSSAFAVKRSLINRPTRQVVLLLNQLCQCVILDSVTHLISSRSVVGHYDIQCRQWRHGRLNNMSHASCSWQYDPAGASFLLCENVWDCS